MAIGIITLVMVAVLVKKSRINNTEENERFNKKFGAFFEEFKDDSTSTRFFYAIFVFRRIVIALLVFFIDSIVIQLAVSFCFALAVSFI